MIVAAFFPIVIPMLLPPPTKNRLLSIPKCTASCDPLVGGNDREDGCAVLSLTTTNTKVGVLMPSCWGSRPAGSSIVVRRNAQTNKKDDDSIVFEVSHVGDRVRFLNSDYLRKHWIPFAIEWVVIYALQSTVSILAASKLSTLRFYAS